jgi:hypothetical protein
VAGAFHGVLSALEGLDDKTRKPGISEEGVMTALFDLFQTSLKGGGTDHAGKARKSQGEK